MQAARPFIIQGRRIDERFTRTRSICFLSVWVGLHSWPRQGAAQGSRRPVSLPNFVHQSGRLGVLWKPG